jgi:hypothetical protein
VGKIVGDGLGVGVIVRVSVGVGVNAMVGEGVWVGVSVAVAASGKAVEVVLDGVDFAIEIVTPPNQGAYHSTVVPGVDCETRNIILDNCQAQEGWMIHTRLIIAAPRIPPINTKITPMVIH